ncbi:MAG: hypothetical protein ACFFBD_19505 [Candidatus Hodarchaeota archaeon]
MTDFSLSSKFQTHPSGSPRLLRLITTPGRFNELMLDVARLISGLPLVFLLWLTLVQDPSSLWIHLAYSIGGGGAVLLLFLPLRIVAEEEMQSFFRQFPMPIIFAGLAIFLSLIIIWLPLFLYGYEVLSINILSPLAISSFLTAFMLIVPPRERPFY